MKKLFTITVLLVMTVVLIPACSKDDNKGNEEEKTFTPSFTMSSNSILINETVYFTNTSINASDDYLWDWDFGDNSHSPISEKFNPKHIYNDLGIYTVKLTAYSSADTTKIDEITATIQVNKNSGPNRIFRVKDISFKMIYVEGGPFTMGATSEQGDDPWDDEYPAHQVTLHDYYIGEFEVTQDLWKTVMGNNPSNFNHGRNYPVEKVSWNDCQEFIKKLNRMTDKTFALPTEAQWEFAARGGNKSQNYKYSGSNNIDDVAWYGDNANRRTHPVGQKRPNELGIYDMSGNLYEWCSDWYDENYYQNSLSTDPKGPSSGSVRVLRGGCWFNKAYNCRVSLRSIGNPNSNDSNYGFRLMLPK